MSQRIRDGPGDFALLLARQAVRPAALRLSARPPAADSRGIGGLGGAGDAGDGREERKQPGERIGVRNGERSEGGERAGRVRRVFRGGKERGGGKSDRAELDGVSDGVRSRVEHVHDHVGEGNDGGAGESGVECGRICRGEEPEGCAAGGELWRAG